MKKGNKLTPKQERYCLNLFQGMSQREAYIKAGYSAKQSENSLDRNASILADNTKIIQRLDELYKEAKSKAIATVEERKQILTDIIRAKLSDFINEDTDLISIHNIKHNRALSEYSITYTKVGDKKKTIKLRDPIAAIAELNRMERIGVHDGDININVVLQKIVNKLELNNMDFDKLTEDELRLLAYAEEEE